MAGQFFQAVDADIAGVRAPAAAAAPAGPVAPAAAAPGVPAGRRCRAGRPRPRRAGRRRGAPATDFARRRPRRRGDRPGRRGRRRRSPGGADHARVHRRRRPGRAGPGPAHARTASRPTSTRCVDWLTRVRRGHRRRARRAARVGDDRLHPRLLPRGALGPRHRAARRGDRADPGRRAPSLGVHVCVGTYERGAERGVVYNSVGAHRPATASCSASTARRTRSAPRSSRGGGWVTPGDTGHGGATPSSAASA